MSLLPEEIAYELDHRADNRQPDLIVVQAVCVPLALIAVVLRIWSRRIVKAPILSDDILIIAGMILALGSTILLSTCVYFGFGRHAIFVKNPKALIKIGIALEALYNPTIATIKFSVLLFYNRVFPGTRLRRILIGLCIFVCCYCITEVFIVCFQCVPLSGLWTRVPKLHCLNFSAGLTAVDSLNALTDVIILSLPLPILWKLDISKVRKVQVSFIFLLGSFVCIIDIYRLTRLSKVSHVDISWDDVDWALWSIVSINTAVVSACLPNLRPLFLVTFSKPGSDEIPPYGKPRQRFGYAMKGAAWSRGRLEGLRISEEQFTELDESRSRSDFEGIIVELPEPSLSHAFGHGTIHELGDSHSIA